MELIKITDLTTQLDITSRSLRYYEEVGLIQSTRPQFEKYRYFDAQNVERLKQIIVLRKMEIPIKDILRIYESKDMSVLVETFVERISAIDREIGTLGELRRIVDSFLQAMLKNGIQHISALPLLYDTMYEEQEEAASATYEELYAVADARTEPLDPYIIDLPPMRTLISVHKDSDLADTQGFWTWLARNGIAAGLPGHHTLFEYQDEQNQTLIMQKIDDTFQVSSPYADTLFVGGLFAVASAYADDDLQLLHRAMIRCFDTNKYFEVDYLHNGGLRHASLVETVISPDGQRDRVSLYLPVKRRLPDASLYDPNEQVADITAAEIELANPILWEKSVAMDAFTPILDPYYRVNADGEAEFIPYIDKRLLSTDVEVTLPFRVDIEFKTDEAISSFASEVGSMRLYHGSDAFCVNMDNNADPRLSEEALQFSQPGFGGKFAYPKLGRINHGVYNHLTWIVGPRHFAMILNGEVRYCGINFPYMSADLRLEKPQPITLGSNGHGKIFLRSVKVSQLVQPPKLVVKSGALVIAERPSNNIIPVIHPIITSHFGENYWFNGCAKYVMECMGEPELDYWFFAGLTGDNLAQVFSFDQFYGDGATDYLTGDPDHADYIERVFDQCGYESVLVPYRELMANRDLYLQTLMDTIDKGLPVICEQNGWGLLVGYEEYGHTLLLLIGDKPEPERIPLEQAIPAASTGTIPSGRGWVFVTEKKRQVDIAQLYRSILANMPTLLTIRTEHYCFGPAAFRAWADKIDSGFFASVTPKSFDNWKMHSIYVCNLATNGSCLQFFKKALALNPDLTFIHDLMEAYHKTKQMWNGQNGEDLESLGGGFNVTLDALTQPERRSKITAKLREYAIVMDGVLELLDANMHLLLQE